MLWKIRVTVLQALMAGLADRYCNRRAGILTGSVMRKVGVSRFRPIRSNRNSRLREFPFQNPLFLEEWKVVRRLRTSGLGASDVFS